MTPSVTAPADTNLSDATGPKYVKMFLRLGLCSKPRGMGELTALPRLPKFRGRASWRGRKGGKREENGTRGEGTVEKVKGNREERKRGKGRGKSASTN